MSLEIFGENPDGSYTSTVYRGHEVATVTEYADEDAFYAQENGVVLYEHVEAAEPSVGRIIGRAPLMLLGTLANMALPQRHKITLDHIGLGRKTDA